MFNGADRSIEGRFNLSLLDVTLSDAFVNLTPLQLLQRFETKIYRKDFLNLSRILVINSVLIL